MLASLACASSSVTEEVECIPKGAGPAPGTGVLVTEIETISRMQWPSSSGGLPKVEKS